MNPSESPIRILGIDHVVIRCRGLPAMLDFYQNVLGLVLVRAREDIGLYQLRAGLNLIDLVPVGSKLGGTTAPDPSAANMAHLCLRIAQPDWAAVAGWLAAAGVADPGAPSERYGADGNGLSVYIEDPEGNVVELKGDPSV